MTPRLPMVRATFRVPPQLWHAAQRRADERGENVSEIIREALKRYVEERAVCDQPKPHNAHWLHIERDGATVTVRGWCDGQPAPEPPMILTLPEATRSKP